MKPLSSRALNRATLARQMLLERHALGAAETVERLIGLQGQVSEGPYQALWSRLADFRHEDLTGLIVGRQMVRATSLRATLHLHTVDDLLGLRPHVQPVLDRMWQGAFGSRQFGDNDVSAVRRAGVRLLNRGPMTGGALGKALQEQFPSGTVLAKTTLMQVKEILVQIPPTRVWGSGHAPLLARVQNWVPAPHRRRMGLASLVQRYLATFGPASVGDMQAWSGMRRLSPVFEALGDSLVRFEDADGRVLHDLPDAPRPDADTPAPIRFLPDYDNVVLGYSDRSRVVSGADQHRLVALTRSFRGVLIDGFVAGGWSLLRGRDHVNLSVIPFRKLTKREHRELEIEAEAFRSFMADQRGGSVAVLTPE